MKLLFVFGTRPEAIKLAPEAHDQRLQALIISAENGPAVAVPLLSESTDRDSLNLLASLQLFSGQLLGCEKTLGEIADLNFVDIATNDRLKPNAGVLAD